jgi:hypothetical protein
MKHVWQIGKFLFCETVENPDGNLLIVRPKHRWMPEEERLVLPLFPEVKETIKAHNSKSFFGVAKNENNKNSVPRRS